MIDASPLHHHLCRRASRRIVDRGFTLAEIAVCFGILAIALSVLLQGMVSLTRARQIASERHRAASTLSRALETLQALGPTEALSNYGVADGPGGEFVALGLQPQSPDLEAAAVEIEFVVDETTTDPSLGLPRDLDGDGAVSTLDVSALADDGKVAATMLPARLTMRWRSFDGTPRSLTWSAIITET